MNKNRLEAFSDGVLAIVLTIMVLELKSPKSASPDALLLVIPGLVSYVVSFIYIGIYWNNHHHMLQAVRHVNGRILWANLHLLFWLSLVPFVTSWASDTQFASLPVAAYGVVLFMAGLAYWILARSLVASHGKDSTLGQALGKDAKGKASLLIYAAAIASAFAEPRFACACYVLVAVMWLVPDRRIESRLRDLE
ncbi:MAG: TMEM175 family protein [Gemmataceae bacterium]|nr:TMEM175 family protein [Gemmataceae bacterium]